MNKVFLIGNLTKDPELSTTTNGVSLCKFTLAVPRKYTSSNGEREADFLPVVVWRGLADNCYKFLKKGSKISLSGAIQTRVYDTPDGNRRYMTEIVADDVEFISTKSTTGDDEDGESEKKPDSEVVNKFEPIDDDNLPF
ncbi:MAG: single-stranded DNA-binding protein [Clostridia bacterium]|nr:single-stranded DNA-binding protein [Clostridia bacterium]